MKLKFIKKKRGFTLVEVLVVVLIIGILATIAYPTYRKAVLRSRAGQAISLLELVRSKQAVHYSKDKNFFVGFDEISGKKLTTGPEHYNPNTPNLLIIGDGSYEVELHPEDKCVISRYIENGEEKFTFSISYLRNGLGCTGEICSSFPDVIGLADDVCTNPTVIVPPGPPVDCPDFDPNSCIYPKVLSQDGCSCVCTSGLTCTAPFVFNEETCECDCDQSLVTTPAHVENYIFNDASNVCDYECNITEDTCAAQDKLFMLDTCECSCPPGPDGSCCCPPGQVKVGNHCIVCSGEYHIFNNVGYCCTLDAPVFNETTHTCEPCPDISTWDPTLKQCVCPDNLALNAAKTACVCNTETGWIPVAQGDALGEHGCCQSGNVRTLPLTNSNGSLQACCEHEAYSYMFSHRYANSRIACCSADRPYVHTSHSTQNNNPGANVMCRKCPNTTDTWDEATQSCHPCPNGLGGIYNHTLGYAECRNCAEHTTYSPEAAGCVCDTEGGWQEIEKGGDSVDSHGCCQDSNVKSLPIPNSNETLKACCAYDAYSYIFSHRYSTSKIGCCTADRPYVHTSHSTQTNDPGATVMCRKCQNLTDTWTEGVGCHPCPNGLEGVYDHQLGYAVCGSCPEHTVHNDSAGTCVCDTEHGWQSIPQGNAQDSNGCCSASNVKPLPIPNSNETLKGCCVYDAYSYMFSHRYATSKVGCCTADRPYVHISHSTQTNDPGANVMCRKCPNETDIWDEATQSCHPCPPGQVCTYDPTTGIASTVNCPDHMVSNADGSGCTCDTEHGWQLLTQGTALDGNNCCSSSNVKSLPIPNSNETLKGCCVYDAYSYMFSHRYATSKVGCCTADRPFVHTSHSSQTNNPGPNAMCRKCQNPMDTWIEGQGCQPCPPGQAAVYNQSLGYAVCQGCTQEHMVLNSAGTGCVCDTEHGWQAALGDASDADGCCYENNVRNLSYNGGVLKACCTHEAYTYGSSSSRNWTSNTACCSADRPFAHGNNGSGHVRSNTNPGPEGACRKCPNATDTWDPVNLCHPCPHNQIGTYNQSDGYAYCSCPPETFMDENGVCKTCAQLYGNGYTYTSGNGMVGTPHCCHPGYEVATTTSSGCEPCPIGTHLSNNCSACECNNVVGLYGQPTDNCTHHQCPAYMSYDYAKCECSCPTNDLGLSLDPDPEKGCCYCELMDETVQGHPNNNDLFDSNGCYIYSN